jgi:hypothetical protein
MLVENWLLAKKVYFVYSKDQKSRKQNYLKALGVKNPKGHKQDSQIRLKCTMMLAYENTKNVQFIHFRSSMPQGG